MSHAVQIFQRKLRSWPARMLWVRRRLTSSWDSRLASFLTVLAVVFGVATYFALKSAPPFGNSADSVIWLLNGDLIIILILGVLIARRVTVLLTVWRKGIPGARLHIRLVYIFGLLAMTPAVIMTVFSLFFFHYGVQTWFSERVRTAVNESQEVAEAYLREHHQVIRADILAMAKDLDREASVSVTNPVGFEKYVQTQSFLRNLSEVVIFSRDGNVLTEAGLSLGFEIQEIPDFAFDRSEAGEVVLLTDTEDDRVRALVKLNNYADSYLYVGRLVEPNVLKHLQTTREAVQKYDEVAARYAGLQMTVSMIYIVVAMVLLLAAVWFALTFARRLATPIGQLIEASDKVRMGDLTARVSDDSGLEEFDYLSRSFNRMTRQIRDQREELVEANRQMDERRRFTETILAGVSSGVVSVGKSGVITLANLSAKEILQTGDGDLTGLDLSTILPEAIGLLEQAYARPQKIHQLEVPYVQPDGARRVLLLRIAIELLGEDDYNAIITFDDITTLQSAQRKAAWADVARRIAHEIKNPLTPIQLSAERLKRKYMKTLPDEDQSIFSQCIDTIVRHVGDIGHMVNEFSSFARMPDPVLKSCDLRSLVRDILSFNQQAHSDVAFFRGVGVEEKAPWPCRCDEQQIRQALTNILQNAIDSIEERQKIESGRGELGLWLAKDDQQNTLIVLADNGLGFPKDRDSETLTEPYVTLKEKGTGLGLAIVKKIMEDHGGCIIFGPPETVQEIPDWKDLGGAVVTLVLPHKDRDDSVYAS